MKATRQAFEKAIAPVLADLERQHPGVLRLALESERSELQAWLWDADGSGTGVYFGDGWEAESDAVVEMAEKVQDVAIEAVWSGWPVCPEHPDGAPLEPARHAGAAFWFCPSDGRAVVQIGLLGLDPTEAAADNRR